MRGHLLIAALGLAALAGGCGSSSAPGGGTAALAPQRGSVVRVVDGDTLVARVGGVGERVRLLGVDAPESVTPDRPVGCYGPEAAAEARRLLPRGTPVILATDPTQGREDRFGRLLAVVTVEGAGTSVNERLVSGGFAKVFRADGRAQLLPALRSAERQARNARRGIWAACPARSGY